MIRGTTELWAADWGESRPRLLARLAHTVDVRCRDVAPDRLAVCDEHGRVLELDLH